MTGSLSSVTRQIAPSVPAPGVQHSLWCAEEAVATKTGTEPASRGPVNVRGFLVYLIFVLNTGSFCNHGVLAPSQTGWVSCGVILGLLEVGQRLARPMPAWSLATAVDPVVPWHGQRSSSASPEPQPCWSLQAPCCLSRNALLKRGTVELSTSFMMQYLFLLGDGFL